MTLASAAMRAPPSSRPVPPVHPRACTSVSGSRFYEIQVLPEAAKHLVQVSHTPPVSATASRPIVHLLPASIEGADGLEVPVAYLT